LLDDFKFGTVSHYKHFRVFVVCKGELLNYKRSRVQNFGFTFA